MRATCRSIFVAFYPLYSHYLPFNVATLGWRERNIGSMGATSARLGYAEGFLDIAKFAILKPPPPNANFPDRELIFLPENPHPY